ncbi:MAG TPA: c-type cytochrome [Puia sp.]|nr:c-type cytochrome [Puia sp.]
MSKKLVVVLSAAVFMAACGNSGETKPADTKDTTTSTTTPATAAPSTAASDKGLELIGASDCTTCHRLNKESSGAAIGPAYSEVAAKYAPAADTTVDRLVKKIISGGSGIWGTIPMTPHPALKADDVKTMVSYIMTLKK